MFTAAATEAKPWLPESVALVQHVLGGVAHRKAVHIDDARGHALAALDAPGGKLQGVAVLKHVDVVRVDAGGLGQLRVGPQVRGLAMDRHEVLRLHDGEHDLQLLGPGMARHVHPRPALVVHVGADLGQLVDDPGDGLLVAGNRRGRDDDGVALFDLDGLVLAVGDAGQSRKRLALAAGAHDDHLLGGMPFRS